MQVTPRPPRNAKLARIAEKVPKILMVRVNAGRDITALLTLQSPFQLNQASSPKVSEMKSRSLAEPVLFRIFTVPLTANNAREEVNALINK